MTKDEALKMALEALMYASYEDIEYDATCATKVLTARNAIKEILAQPEQEPVAFYNPQHGGFYWAKPTTIHAPQAVDIVPLALYASPPQRQTDQEPWLLESTQTLAKTLAREFYPEVTQWECLNDLAGVISQIDNMTTGLMRKTEQEPVAWQWLDTATFRKKIPPTGESECWNPLYASPPQRQQAPPRKREWVGLTNAEVNNAAAGCHLGNSVQDAIRQAEAALKGKNT